MKHYNITISGKVQGVFFRKYTVEQAEQLSLKGFVRNEPNGDVYCEVEGEEELLNKFETWCWRGSPFSKVEKVVRTEGGIQHFPSFLIRR
ncbi:MAG: acylphosphatase [Bacteroidota bacterium]